MKISLTFYLINCICICHSNAFHTYRQGRENGAQKHKAYNLLSLGTCSSVLTQNLVTLITLTVSQRITHLCVLDFPMSNLRTDRVSKIGWTSCKWDFLKALQDGNPQITSHVKNTQSFYFHGSSMPRIMHRGGPLFEELLNLFPVIRTMVSFCSCLYNCC